jgi:hypothetical protein
MAFLIRKIVALVEIHVRKVWYVLMEYAILLVLLDKLYVMVDVIQPNMILIIVVDVGKFVLALNLV